MSYYVFLFCCVNCVLSQGTGSGTDGNLRLCIVEGKGAFKRGSKFCPVLDSEKSGVECVLGSDRLDCIRRISKGTVDFGVFSPEDLVAAQWAQVDVLVTNELRERSRPFARSIVAVVNKRIIPETKSSLEAILRNTSLCHPVMDSDNIRPLSDTFSQYLESLLTTRSCDPSLSIAENTIKSTAEFFSKACRAGPWVPDINRDAELKSMYPSLCSACVTRTCSTLDQYWGNSGALHCLTDGAGDVVWAELDDVTKYFEKEPESVANGFGYLCRDGTWQPLVSSTKEPCVWLQRPWNVIVAKRKAAEAVSQLTSVLANSSAAVDNSWHGALAMLLESHREMPLPLQPALPPTDFLAKAIGFNAAFSQHGCDPPRHITLCTTSLLENNKCEWLAEAGAVHGVAPPLQCSRRNNTEQCLQAVHTGQSDVTVADSDWLVAGKRDYSLTTILHEATPIMEKTRNVFAYVRKDASIAKMADLRGKRAAFPSFDGFEWHSVFRYLSDKEKSSCKDTVNNYFSAICAPDIEKHDVSKNIKDSLTKGCVKDENGDGGDVQALRSLVEGKSDVAFISMNTYKMYQARQILEPWANDVIELKYVCPEENTKYCFLGWSNIGHIFTASHLTPMRQHEIINVFTKLDQLFGNKHVNSRMFSMYGTYNHKADVIFHNNTKTLKTNQMFETMPYERVPLNFERTLNSSDSCHYADLMRGNGAKTTPALVSLITLVVSIFLVS